MPRLLSLLLLAATLIGAGAASACEKHLEGHSSGSDTEFQSSQR